MYLFHYKFEFQSNQACFSTSIIYNIYTLIDIY